MTSTTSNLSGLAAAGQALLRELPLPCEPTPKGGHTLRVTFSDYTVKLTLVCHEPENSDLCRLVCSHGCESAAEHHPDHVLVSTECNAVLWLQEDLTDACTNSGDFPLYDGMPVRVTWDGIDTYEWEPILDTEGKVTT